MAWDPTVNAAERFISHACYFFAGAAIWPVLRALGAEQWNWPRWAPLESVGRSSVVWYVAHFAPMLLVCSLLAGKASDLVVYSLCALFGFGVPWLLARFRPTVAWLFAAPRPGQKAMLGATA